MLRKKVNLKKSIRVYERAVFRLQMRSHLGYT